MLLSEQERLLANEVNLINNPTLYMITNTLWYLIYDYGQIQMPADGILFFSVQFDSGTTGTTQIAVYVRNMPIAVGVLGTSGSMFVAGAVWLAAGTYAEIQVYGVTTGAGADIKNMQVGYTAFNDSVGYALQATASGSSISLTVSSRVTPVGALKQAVYGIIACSFAPSGQTTTISAITVDGVLQSFDESNGSGTQAASVKCYVPCAVGSSHTVVVSQSNSSATLYLSIIACPWICTSISRMPQPVTLSFPQQSTVYVVIGILFKDCVKSIWVGKQKGISFGAADYYGYSSAGTGTLLSFNYSFDSVNVAQVLFCMGGLGCCVDSIAVDVM
jgi:hypothetical protein